MKELLVVVLFVTLPLLMVRVYYWPFYVLTGSLVWTFPLGIAVACVIGVLRDKRRSK